MMFCPNCRTKLKTMDHLATQCDRMIYHSYTHRYNKVVRCIYLGLCKKYGIKAFLRMRDYSMREMIANEKVDIRIDTAVHTSLKNITNCPDIMIHEID